MDMQLAPAPDFTSPEGEVCGFPFRRYTPRLEDEYDGEYDDMIFSGGLLYVPCDMPDEKVRDVAVRLRKHFAREGLLPAAQRLMRECLQ